MTFRPKFVSFDCHGTMIYFDMAGAARDHYGAQLSPEDGKLHPRFLGLPP